MSSKLSESWMKHLAFPCLDSLKCQTLDHSDDLMKLTRKAPSLRKVKVWDSFSELECPHQVRILDLMEVFFGLPATITLEGTETTVFLSDSSEEHVSILRNNDF